MLPELFNNVEDSSKWTYYIFEEFNRRFRVMWDQAGGRLVPLRTFRGRNIRAGVATPPKILIFCTQPKIVAFPPDFKKSLPLHS